MPFSSLNMYFLMAACMPTAAPWVSPERPGRPARPRRRARERLLSRHEGLLRALGPEVRGHDLALELVAARRDRRERCRGCGEERRVSVSPVVPGQDSGLVTTAKPVGHQLRHPAQQRADDDADESPRLCAHGADRRQTPDAGLDLLALRHGTHRVPLGSDSSGAEAIRTPPPRALPWPGRPLATQQADPGHDLRTITWPLDNATSGERTVGGDATTSQGPRGHLIGFSRESSKCSWSVAVA